jgi:hypothetical protein
VHPNELGYQKINEVLLPLIDLTFDLVDFSAIDALNANTEDASGCSPATPP